MWIDTHCHLDAAEFEADRRRVLSRARAAGVTQLVIPAVEVGNFDAVRQLAHAPVEQGPDCRYALGIHPLFVPQAREQDVQVLRAALARHHADPALVAVGEIGLDFLVPGHDLRRQEWFYAAQLELAREFDLPVIVHVRRSADVLLKHLRRVRVAGGIAHAFNGSAQQAGGFVDLGLRLGFGGAMTFDRALQIRRLAAGLPAEALVLETDAPDIPPQWLYLTAAQRAAGGRTRNEPGELPRIAQSLQALRGWTPQHAAAVTSANARHALPRLAQPVARPPAEPAG